MVVQLIQFLFLVHNQADYLYIQYHHQYLISFYDDYDLIKTIVNKRIKYLFDITNQIYVLVV